LTVFENGAKSEILKEQTKADAKYIKTPEKL
jgi:hypothetical protein